MEPPHLFQNQRAVGRVRMSTVAEIVRGQKTVLVASDARIGYETDAMFLALRLEKRRLQTPEFVTEWRGSDLMAHAREERPGDVGKHALCIGTGWRRFDMEQGAGGRFPDLQGDLQ